MPNVSKVKKKDVFPTKKLLNGDKGFFFVCRFLSMSRMRRDCFCRCNLVVVLGVERKISVSTTGNEHVSGHHQISGMAFEKERHVRNFDWPLETEDDGWSIPEVVVSSKRERKE